MANNRLLVYCKKCKELSVLDKYYPSGGWGGIYAENYDNFVKEHQEKCYSPYPTDVNGGDDMFGFTTENAGLDDWIVDYRERRFRFSRPKEIDKNK